MRLLRVDGAEGSAGILCPHLKGMLQARNEPKKERLNVEQGMTNAQVRNPEPLNIQSSLLDIQS
jgi:hypothetical protein